MSKLVVFLACAAFACAPALADSSAPLAPSAIVASPSNFDQQTVTVAGTVKGVTTENGARGAMTRYQLCDAQCVNVVQFAGTAPAEGQAQTVTGRFRANVTRGHMQGTNVILVAPAGGWRGRH